MRRAARHLAWVMGLATLCLLALPSVASADRFPSAGDFNGLVITYSISGVSIESSEDIGGFTTSRVIKGKVTGGRLEVSGSAAASAGWSAAATVSVSAGGESDSFSAQSHEAPRGLFENPWSESFSVGVDVPKGASGTITIVLSGEYNAGGRALSVSGTFDAGEATGATTTTVIGGAGSTGGGATGKPNKVPGPGRWWEWLAGTLVPGLIAGGLSLAGGLFGGGGAPPAPPRPKFVPYPYDGPSIGPSKPYRDTPGGPLKYPPGTKRPPGAPPEGPPPAEWVPETSGGALGKTVVDAAKALGKGVYDFGAGTLKTIVTGWEEIGNLGFEMTDSRGPSIIKEVWDSPSIIWNTPLNIAKDMLESINPTEELEALNDPHMSPEGKAYAVASLALKAANAILMWQSAKDLKKALEAKYQALKESAGRAPVEPKPITPKEVKPPDPTARTSKMTPAEATAQAEKMVPAEKAAAYEKYKRTVESTVDDLAGKVKSGEPVTPRDVLEVTKDPSMTRKVLGKSGEPVPPEVTDAVKAGRRAIYNETDDVVRTELQKNPKYADGKIRAKEVSTGGEADAAGSADRDIMYVHEKQVVGKGGKIRTVEEPIPRSHVEAIHNDAFAKATKFDPAKPVEGIDPAAWEKMSLPDKQAAHARQYQQMVMDRTSPEYIAEYSAQRPAGVSPEKWNRMSLAEQQAAHSKATGKITSDPAEMGKIYQETKFKEVWERGTPGQQTEALRQLGKTGDAAQQAAQSSGRVLDPQTLDALEIVKRGGDPAVVDQAVRNLGVHGGVEGLANRLRSVIESKKLNLSVPK